MTQERLVELVRQSTRAVFGTMLGIDLDDGEARTAVSAPEPVDGVVAIIGLAGRWVGSGTFSCSAEAAKKISGQMLMQEFTAVDADVLDAVGEVTNMILGNVKTSLEEEYGAMGLSIPTVIYGRNFTTRSVGRNEWTVVPFHCLDSIVEVHLCLVPGSETGLSVRQTAILSIH
jgi:chemotaxis protein CheX